MKYNKIFITCVFISIIGNIYAQDNIINEIDVVVEKLEKIIEQLTLALS